MTDDAKRKRWELITLLAMYAGYAAFMLCRNTLIASSAAVIQDPTAGIDKAAYGRLMSWHSAGAIAGKLTLGVVADRLGGRLTFIMCLGVTALTTAVFGLTSAFVVFAIFNFTGQFFKSGGWPAIAKVIGDWYAPHHYGRTWAIISTSSRVGTFSAGLLVGALLGVMGWRPVFAITGGIAAAVLVALWFILRERPADVGLEPPPHETTDGEAIEDVPHPLDDTTLLEACVQFARSPRVWLICASMAALTILMDFLNFIPIYLSENVGLDAGQAGMAGSTFPIGMFVALIACSVFYPRLSKAQLTLAIGGLLALAVVCATALWMLPSLGLGESLRAPIAIASIFVLGFAVSPAYYLPMSVFSVAFGGKHSGFLIAMIDVFGYLGAYAFNFFGGEIAQTYGWPVFLGGLLSVAVFALVTMTAFLRIDAQHRV